MFNNEVHQYLTSLMGFFVRKGKKTKTEALFHNYIQDKMISNKKNLYALLKRCKIKTSTYLQLIERRRGKRSKYRVWLLADKYIGVRRGLLLVGRSAYLNTKKSSRQFKSLLNQELETWSLGKHSLKQKYKASHILAKRHAPRSWFFKSKFKKNLNNTMNNTMNNTIKKRL